MGSRFQQAQRLQRLTLTHTARILARNVHQSTRHNTAIQGPSSSDGPAQILSTKTYRQGSTPKSVLARLPTSSVARSYLITAMSSSPALLGLTFTVLRKMLENEDLRAQAVANNKADFFSGPDLWHTIQEVIVDATDSQQRGLERLAADRSREEILTIMGMMKLWETLREPA